MSVANFSDYGGGGGGGGNYNQGGGGGYTPSPPHSGGYSSAGDGGRVRAYPSYSVATENVIFSLKLMLPQYRVVNNVVSLNPPQRGRVLLEWIPRDAMGKLIRDKEAAARFALSAEEVGLLLDQIPNNTVEFFRKPRVQGIEYNNVVDDDVSENTTPEKALRVIPGDAGLVTFKCDFELNGIGGQKSMSGETHGPMEATVQLGEFIVMREIMRSAIPLLVGWETMTKIAMDRTLENAIHQGNTGNSGYGGGGGDY
eukprot:CAMPEP_0198147714 /NCGR_PEP_ID=MMETSP1443-20131203/37414_1 /TAXON_ID=186043 /ORGANISM="Entomoneis sp., Strain CCMP2396" /LENGTH=254 /DNA_ID=CAMNT_0043812161 /DNA_START=166 /DNA_END=930 /DNA_ORIENTATION=+